VLWSCCHARCCAVAEFDAALKAVDAEFSAAEKDLGATRKKAEEAASAMKELEHKDTKVSLCSFCATCMQTEHLFCVWEQVEV
jgi:hypothetical protein